MARRMNFANQNYISQSKCTTKVCIKCHVKKRHRESSKRKLYFKYYVSRTLANTAIDEASWHDFKIRGSRINISNQSSSLTKLSTMAAGRRGFLYICIGSGCEPWQIALMVVTIVLVVFCCCAGACLRSEKNARSDRNCKVY